MLDSTVEDLSSCLHLEWVYLRYYSVDNFDEDAYQVSERECSDCYSIAATSES